jgi:hypothetical protein
VGIVGRVQQREPGVTVEDFELVEAATGFGDDRASRVATLEAEDLQHQRMLGGVRGFRNGS